MNEEVSNKSVNLAVSSAKVTARVLYRALLEAYRNMKHQKNYKHNQVYKHKGKQTLKQLIGQNQGVSSMEINDEGIRTFKRIANRHGVDFAITKDKSCEPPKYLVFFKARDADAIKKVLQDYSRQIVKKKEVKRESVLEKLKKLKEIVKLIPRKEKKREHVR